MLKTCTIYYVLFLLVSATMEYSRADTNAHPESLGTGLNTDSAETYRTAVKSEFADVKAFLISAIEERGIKISNILHISDMLQRTGEAVGDNNPIYKKAEAIEFCSAKLSRELMQSDPHNIIFCPFSILIYELAGAPGTTYMAYRRPFYHAGGKSDSSQWKIDNLLHGIVEDAAK
jgi:uncharacterized protein (DUF302 family)